MKTKMIHILPELPCPSEVGVDEFEKCFMRNRELAATITFIPDSIKTLRKIDYLEVKMLMRQNDGFFSAVEKLCSNMIKDLIKYEKKNAAKMFKNGEIEESEYREIQSIATLDDLLNSGCYGDDYEDSRWEFTNVFVEDYLCK